MNLSAAVAALSFDVVDLVRPTWALVAGAQIVTLPDAVEIDVSATQLRGKDLEKLAEARRTNGGVQLFATSELLVGDRITWHSAEYEVDHAEDWSTYGYWLAYASKRLP